VERRLFAATDPDTAVRIAAALERHSRHPVARAFEEAGRRLSFDIEAASVTHSPAAGVSGLVEGVRWQLGKPEFVSGQQRMNPEVSALVDRWRGRGLVVIALAREGRVHALFGLNDEPRPGLQKMLDELRRQGISEMAVLSGDSRANTSRLANRFGIEEGLGDLAPADKLDWIGRAQARGKTVIMLGDGINDAPTLAAANVSLSFAEATELAQVHSDFLLMTPRIGVVGEALGLARRTHRIIRQNLAWAAGYNLLAVPAAALGYIPPWGAAIGMSLSSLLVVGNAWRLRRTRRGDPVLPVKEGHSTGQQNVTV
jgi:Cu2+-exporting ATPase